MNIDISTFTEHEIDNAIIDTIGFFEKIPSIDMKRLTRQIEITKSIMLAFQHGQKIAIIDAPTGFGKSILGFFLHFTIVNLTRKKKPNLEDDEDYFRSYILTSNKYLQEQYQRDIKLFDFYDIKMLKGKSNYLCNVDKMTPFPKAACKDESVKQLSKDGINNKFPCYAACDYLNARRDAINASSTIFNYAYFLTTMNFVTAMLGPSAPFKVRDLTIFDECHVVADIKIEY